MNILNKLNENMGGSTLNGKNGLVNLILSYREKYCMCCYKKFVMYRPEHLQLKLTRHFCNDCYKTFKWKKHALYCLYCEEYISGMSCNFNNMDFCRHCIYDSDSDSDSDSD